MVEERRFVVDGLSLSYKGLFEVEALLNLVYAWLRNKGYSIAENEVEEKVSENHKDFTLIIEPRKKITEKVSYVMHIEVLMKGVEEVPISMQGHKYRLEQGRVDFMFHGFITTEYEYEWIQKAYVFFLRALFSKFIYGIKNLKYDGGLVEEVNALSIEIKSFLNLYRYSPDKRMPDVTPEA
ncbi:hypothetical protein HZB01_05505 [Candidatus Woesearchaeota archaeon]|nr:hypothetical protein [Candidatus Woesearchaeota archaeon]